MNKTNIEKYAKTGEFRATLDFHKRDVDWNVIHNHVRSGCHCVWVESDLESYVTVYGIEKSCVIGVIENMSNEIED